MHTHDGMDCFDFLAPHMQPSSARALRLRSCTVDGMQALEVLLEPRREARIQCIARAEERVAASGRDRNTLERGRAWRLELIRHVGVPKLEFGESSRIGTPGGVIVHNCGK